MTQSTFGLKIPEKNTESQDGIDIRPKKIAAWIKALPMADTGVTTQQLYELLSKVNRTSLPAQDRYKLMEQLREPISYCTNSLKKNFTGKSFPLSPKSEQLSEKSFLLLAETATGYKIAIVDLLSENRVEKKILAYCVHRTMRLLGNILLTSYQLYFPEPSELWQEMHRLYLLSESGEILDIPIKDPENKLSKLNSISKAYKQIILLSLSNPYHLRNGEIELIHTALDLWAQYSEIFASQTIPKENNLFVCGLYTDEAPQHLSVSNIERNKYNRYIDLTHLSAMLRREISQSDNSTSNNIKDNRQPLANDLLKRLLIIWNSRSKREFSRFLSATPISVSIGLNGTHHILEQELASKQESMLAEEDEETGTEADTPDAEPAASSDEETGYAAKEPLGDPTIVTPMEFSIASSAPQPDENLVTYLQSSSSKIITSLNQLSDASSSTQLPEPKYEAQTLQTLNVSAGGYCLLWDNDQSSNVNVGEIIGIREIKDDPQSWSIGVVRWMQNIRNKGLKLGIQILSTDAESITSSINQPDHEDSNKTYNCLGLPEIESINQSATLLTPALHYKVGDALTLNNQDSTLQVQLTRILENTKNFTHFQYLASSVQDDAFDDNNHPDQKQNPKDQD
jgi:hypothetical protein